MSPGARTNTGPDLGSFLIANGVPVVAGLALVFRSDPILALEGMLCASAVLPVQYRAMRACRSAWSRALVLYAAMLAWLFAFGVVLAWGWAVGDSPAGSWAARLDAGLRVAILGHVVGVIGYPFLLWANSLLSWPKR